MIDISVIDDGDGFASLRDGWNRCLEASDHRSVFVTWEWQYHWWVHYGAGRPLRIFVARRDGRVVGALPLYVRKERQLPGLSSRILRFVGTGEDTSPDYLEAVVDADGGSETLAALCAAVLSDRSWDALELTDVRCKSAFPAALEEAGRRRRCTIRQVATGGAAIARLPDTWEEYLRGLTRNQRHNVRRARSRLETEHGARFFRWGDPSGLDQVIDRLAELHRLRWAGRVEQCGFSTPEYVAFHRDVIHQCHDRDWLRLNCLELNGEIIAASYSYAYRGEVALFQTGFDPAYDHLRPGYALLGWSIEQAIREGMRVFDFLGGDQAYKRIWARSSREVCLLRASRKTPAGLLAQLRQEHLPRLRDRLRKTVEAARPGASSPLRERAVG